MVKRTRGRGLLPSAIIWPQPGPAVASVCFFLHIFIIYPKEASQRQSSIIPKSTWCPLLLVAEAERGGEMIVGQSPGQPRWGWQSSVRHLTYGLVPRSCPARAAAPWPRQAAHSPAWQKEIPCSLGPCSASRSCSGIA